MIKLKTIKPSKNSTYKIALDDHCLVVGAGEAISKVWLSKSMCMWIAKNYKQIDFKNQKWLKGVKNE